MAQLGHLIGLDIDLGYAGIEGQRDHGAGEVAPGLGQTHLLRGQLGAQLLAFGGDEIEGVFQVLNTLPVCQQVAFLLIGRRLGDRLALNQGALAFQVLGAESQDALRDFQGGAGVPDPGLELG